MSALFLLVLSLAILGSLGYRPFSGLDILQWLIALAVALNADWRRKP